MEHKYTINISYSNEDKCYIAKVEELGPYISAFGDTYEEALSEIKKVIELTIESYEEDKLPMPKTRKGRKKHIA